MDTRIIRTVLRVPSASVLRTVPTNKEVFCAVYVYAGKADLSKGYWNPKRKLGVTTHLFRDN